MTGSTILISCNFYLFKDKKTSTKDYPILSVIYLFRYLYNHELLNILRSISFHSSHHSFTQISSLFHKDYSTVNLSLDLLPSLSFHVNIPPSRKDRLFVFLFQPHLQDSSHTNLTSSLLIFRSTTWSPLFLFLLSFPLVFYVTLIVCPVTRSMRDTIS